MNLELLNSATKYPSIPVLHKLNDRGVPTDECLSIPSEPLFVTEKIDGTNARIIVIQDVYRRVDWFIGSRESLLTARGDRIFNNQLGVVEATHHIADMCHPQDFITVYYGEVYGHKINAGGNYTQSGHVGFRLFDIATITQSNFDILASMSRSEVAKWRESVGPEFFPYLLDERKPDRVDCVPVIYGCRNPPTDVRSVKSWLDDVSKTTRCGLDNDEIQRGYSEGVVVRTADRSFIAKIRHDDYRKMKP